MTVWRRSVSARSSTIPLFRPHAVDRLGLAADDPRRQNVQILNPLTEEQAVMRTTLVPSLLETAARNIAYRTVDLALFELRPVFHPRGR